MKKNTSNEEIELPKLKSIYNTIVNTTNISVEKIKDILNNKNKKRKKQIIIPSIIIGLLLIGLCIYISIPPKILSIDYNETINNNNTQTLIVKFKTNNNFPSKCKINNKKWVKSKNNKCLLEVSTGNNKIYIKNLFNISTLNKNIVVNGVKSVKLDSEKYYLALGESLKLNATLEVVGEVNSKLKWISSNPNVVSVEDGIITGLEIGESQVTVTSDTNSFYTTNVIVTNLITPMILDDKKTFLTCNVYTDEEGKILDDILKTRIDIKGEKSRAALIETIRFLTLSFKYKVPYFFENGRLEPYGKMHYVDGEGRYYHKGLYLTNSKKNDIIASLVGPATWGCPLTNFDDSYGWVVGGKYPNGLDCSGFVSWALYNSGIDVKDIGAGITNNVDDLSDLGEMHKLTFELINNKEFKVGDIIGWDGHVALIAGVDDENIYIAESLLKGARLSTFNYKNPHGDLYKKYTYVNNMDNVYERDGIYNDMWN